MAGHKRYQKLTAVLTLLGLVLALIPVAVLALPKAQAEPADPAHPIIGSADDPWPSDPNREEESKDIKSAGSVALVFEFGNAYGYQSMGGVIPRSNIRDCPANPNSDNPQDWPGRANVDGLCRNWGQNKELEKVITSLKGSPLSIGIYHYARKMDKNDGINGPDLKATSLADQSGFDKVINKIRSLDASDGYGGARSQTWFGGNSEWGLGKLYRDMYQYQEQQKKEHADDPNFVPRPLYSKIIIMSVSDPHWRLEKNTWWDSRKGRYVTYHDKEGNFVVDPDNLDTDDDHGNGWNDPNNLEWNPGRLAMLDVVRMIRGLGADIRTVGMGYWIQRWGPSRTYFMRYLTGEDPYYPDKYSSTDNYQYIDFPDDRGDPNPNWFGKGGEYFRGKYSKDGIANGTYAKTMRRWLTEDTHFSLTSDLVDQDFRYAKPNAGQKIDFTPLDTTVNPQNYLTGSDGRVVLNLNKANMGKGVEIRRPVRSNDSVLTKFQQKNVRCGGMDRESGDFIKFTPDELAPDAAGKVGFKITADQIKKYYSIKCATYSRPLQKMIYKKKASANSQIRYIVGGYPDANNKYTKGDGASYTITWSCKDPLGEDPNAVVGTPGTTTRQIKGLDLVANLEPDIDLTANGPVPVGTKCTITEDIKMPQGFTYDQANAYFGSKSVFTGTNFQVDENQTQKIMDPAGLQSIKNVIVGNITLYNPQTATKDNSELLSETIYDSLRASIRVKFNFANSKNDPALAARIAQKKLPDKVPLYYNCRFMPDPTKPPELPEKNTGNYPGYVGATWVGVKTDGTAELVLGKDEAGKDSWPVGTHCLFSTTPPNQNISGPNLDVGEPVKIDGVITKDSYNSNVCAEDAKAKLSASQAKNCRNNYFWVHSPGESVINITEDLQRLQGKLRVTKELDGPAATLGIGKRFPMNLTCKDPEVNTTVPIAGQDIYKFGVTSTESELVEKVPAGLSCDLTEEAIGANTAVSNAQLQLPTIPPVKITDTTIETPVTVKNTLDYKEVDLTINHQVAYNRPEPAPGMKSNLESKDNLVSVSCQLPGDSKTISKTATITGNGSVRVPEIPAGSVCDLQSVPQDVEGLGVKYAAPPQSVTIGENGATANLTTTYSLPSAGEISVQGLVKSRPQYDALKIPDSLDATVECEKPGANPTQVPITIDLKGGTSTTVPSNDIAEGASCTVKANLDDLEGKIEWKWSNQDDLAQAQDSPVAYQFTAPVGNNSANVVIRLWAKTKTATVNLAANSTMWTSKSADDTTTKIPVPKEWRKAVLGIDSDPAKTTKVSMGVTCTLGSGANQSTANFAVNVSNDGTASPLEVPANWDCTANTSDSALKINGTTMQPVVWTGPGAPSNSDEYSYQWKSAADQTISLQRDYRLQLASFNLKKKVGGEGVAIISGGKQFKMNWSCSLNGKPIPIPGLRAITVDTDAPATFGDDLADRLQERNLHPSVSTQMGRFTQGEWHVVDALPAGAVCTVSEDMATAQVKQTLLDHYWEITPGYRSREPASPCEEASNKCRPANEGTTIKAQVLLPRDQPARNNIYKAGYGNVDAKDAHGKRINPIIPDTLPENFAGTMVPWNNYTFEKTQVKVSLTNSGNGAPLAKGKTFKARLYCAPPSLIGGSEVFENEAEFQEAVAAQSINVDLTFEESATNPGVWQDAIGSQMVPVGYSCVLAEAKFPELDAQVTTTIAKDSSQPTDTAGEDGLTALFKTKKENKQLKKKDDEKEILGFIVHGDLVGLDSNRQQKQSIFTIDNKFDRPAAKLKVKQVVTKDDTATQKSFGKALVDNNDVGYTLHYECTDKYLRDEQGKPLVYQDSKVLAADSEINLFSAEGAGGAFVPATSQCVFWHVNQDHKDPIAKYQNKLLLQPNATVVTPGAEEQFESVANQLVPDPLKVVPANLDSTGKNETTLTFEDTYFIPFVIYEIGTAVEGDRRDEALPKDTTKYQYSYSCEAPAGLPLPNEYPDGYPKVEGTTDEAVRATFVPLKKVIGGSKCKVTGTKAVSAQPHLKLAANWVPWDQNVNVLGIVLDDTVKFTGNERGEVTGKTQLTTSPFEVTLEQNNRRGVVLYSVFNNGTKVRIYKAKSPQGEVVPDATFSLYATKAGGTAQNPTVEPGDQIDLVPVEGKPGVYESKTELAPGTYLMGNTSAGKNAGERFPFAWKFDITVNPANQPAEQDTKVTLSKETGSSGLVAAYAPTEEVKAWQIELADVKFGKLPLTGGYLPWLWLLGISLVAASAAVMWHRRRE